MLRNTLLQTCFSQLISHFLVGDQVQHRHQKVVDLPSNILQPTTTFPKSLVGDRLQEVTSPVWLRPHKAVQGVRLSPFYASTSYTLWLKTSVWFNLDQDKTVPNEPVDEWSGYGSVLSVWQYIMGLNITVQYWPKYWRQVYDISSLVLGCETSLCHCVHWYIMWAFSTGMCHMCIDVSWDCEAFMCACICHVSNTLTYFTVNLSCKQP